MKSALLATRGKVRGSRGVALVITLILLAVITFMAITFLVVSQSERGAVSTTTDQTTARIAADNALERAKSELLMPIMAFSNAYAFDMLVSTNYFNRIGFVSNLESPTNVNFDYRRDANLSPLSPSDYLLNLHNLLYSPRVPVFMRDASGQMKSVHYLDINRNGLEERTGMLIVTNSRGEAVVDSNGRFVTNYFYGDPEWVGGLEFPERPHSATNRFTFRYAYVVAPVGKTLDINYMHNAGRLPGTWNGDYFVRNQGVGTWELNLASFLTDLNTNLWYSVNPDEGNFPGWGSGYFYNTQNLFAYNQGAGFDDATALLRYRYAQALSTLWNPTLLFGNRADTVFRNDSYDTYGGGPLALTTAIADPEEETPSRLIHGWPGSHSTNLFYSPNDFFDRTKTGLGGGGRTLTDRLEEAGKRRSSYDRYTFHRLLSQLGTESAPETARINVNYRNVDAERIVPNLETNFTPWTPADFFTNAANRLLQNAGFLFTVTNIQIYPTNHYTPAVHRCLQLAANIYEATWTNATGNQVGPRIYRPHFSQFSANGTNFVYITGYTELKGIYPWNYLDVVLPTDRSRLPEKPRFVPGEEMVYGVPLVIGARKGFPNFNEFAMDTKLTVTRKLEFRRAGNSANGAINETNQMYTVALTNRFGVEFWNSYSNTYPRQLEVRVVLDVYPSITNEFNEIVYPNAPFNYPVMPFTAARTIAANAWRPFSNVNMDGGDGSIIYPMTNGGAIFIPFATYLNADRRLIPLTAAFERNTGFPIPHWKLNIRTRLVATIIDRELGQLVDYVNLVQSEPPLDIADALQRDNPGSEDPSRIYQPSGSPGALWITNRYRATSSQIGAATFGVLNQIRVSQNNGAVSPSWGSTNYAEIDFFRAQFPNMTPLHAGTYSKTNIFHAPFSPTRDLHVYTTWQANDPLVHYTVGDLTEMGGNTNQWGFQFSTNNIGRINKRYQPWTGQSLHASTAPTKFDLGVKDPLVSRSDDWDFPAGKLANVGWLGRVHRGTPWQTVYLKSRVVNYDTWMKWGGSGIRTTNINIINTNLIRYADVIDDSLMSHPTNDWAVADIFTAALYDNATRGQLSINQTNLAAWSAVLAGVPVISNVNASASWSVIQPAAVDHALDAIVGGIARGRAARPGGTFKRLAEICSVPELTVDSPYLDKTGDVNSTLSEAVYERIPQQILGLLRCEETPRFVVYAYGQALKPANGSIEPSTGMVTNYQVTAEVATRAVVRVEGAPHKPRVVIENFNVLPPD